MTLVRCRSAEKLNHDRRDDDEEFSFKVSRSMRAEFVVGKSAFVLPSSD